MKIPYLVSEINAAMEIYLIGRIGQQYNRTAFILCDDCAELASKLFLITNIPNWSDDKPNGRFKNFIDVTNEVAAAFAPAHPNHAAITCLLNDIKSRRNRRNKFFHSTDLLDLNLHSADCVRAFVDLLDYCKLLFPNEWENVVAATGNMESCEAVLRIDKKSYTDPAVTPRFNEILRGLPRSGTTPHKKGCEVVYHPEDIHLRLAIRNGSKALRDKLRKLL